MTEIIPITFDWVGSGTAPGFHCGDYLVAPGPLQCCYTTEGLVVDLGKQSSQFFDLSNSYLH